jgi:hypothetical protein
LIAHLCRAFRVSVTLLKEKLIPISIKLTQSKIVHSSTIESEGQSAFVISEESADEMTPTRVLRSHHLRSCTSILYRIEGHDQVGPDGVCMYVVGAERGRGCLNFSL